MIENKILETEKRLLTNLDEALNIAAKEAITYIISKWPVDSGRSKSGWRYEIKGTHIEIYNVEDYVKYVTYKGSKKTILADLLEEVKPMMKSRIYEVIKR